MPWQTRWGRSACSEGRSDCPERVEAGDVAARIQAELQVLVFDFNGRKRQAPAVLRERPGPRSLGAFREVQRDLDFNPRQFW